MADRVQLDFGQALESESSSLYQNIRRVGRGGSADTFLVLATSGTHSGLLFAAKVFRRRSKPEWIRNFLREHDFLRQCDHPAIMRVFDQGSYLDQSPFVIAEYLPQTLATVAGNLDVARKLSLATQMLAALTYLALPEHMVIHRDIKPTNIFLKGESWVLGDFGLMKRVTGSDPVDHEMFAASFGPRMPKNYRTPDLVEYLRGGTLPTIKSDVFQLGLVLAEVFCGRNPQTPAGFDEDVELEPLPQIDDRLGNPIRELVARMLAIAPDDRPHPSDILPQWQDLYLLNARYQQASQRRR